MIRLDLPPAIRFAPDDVVTVVADVLQELAARRVFVVTTPRMPERRRFGAVIDGLRRSGATWTVWPGATAEPGRSELDAAYASASAFRPDVLLAVGGGSAMDLAKLTSVLLVGGPPIDRYLGVGRVPARGLPTVMVPTTAGSGSEVSQDAVLTDREAGTKVAVKDPHIVPAAAVIDPTATVECPPKLTAIAGADALTHALEALTARGANVVTDMFAEHAIRLLWTHLPAAVRTGGDLDARSGTALGALMAGIAFTTTGTAAVHACGYPLSGVYGIPHGMANALMLASVVAFNAETCTKYERLADVLGGADVHERLRAFVGELGLPTRLRDVGVTRESLPRLAVIAAADERHLRVNPRPLRREELVGLFAEAW